jgi:hypothetical protein
MVARERSEAGGIADAATDRLITRLAHIYPKSSYENASLWSACGQATSHLLTIHRQRKINVTQDWFNFLDKARRQMVDHSLDLSGAESTCVVSSSRKFQPEALPFAQAGLAAYNATHGPNDLLTKYFARAAAFALEEFNRPDEATSVRLHFGLLPPVNRKIPPAGSGFFPRLVAPNDAGSYWYDLTVLEAGGGDMDFTCKRCTYTVVITPRRGERPPSTCPNCDFAGW